MSMQVKINYLFRVRKKIFSYDIDENYYINECLKKELAA
jgi:hypothetical protein